MAPVAPIESRASSFVDRLAKSLSKRSNGWFDARRTAPSQAANFGVRLHKLAVYIVKREDKTPDKFDKGTGTVNPYKVNNKGILGLFALLFAALILAAIWFFFWAKNGGFHFKKGDWDDYKSTVLRRKGPDGKTLSGATRSTKLDHSSIEGDYDVEDVPFQPVNRDTDVREYRHEKPARVGGLNRKADGSYYDHTNTDRSTVTFDLPRPSPSAKEKKSNWFSRNKNTPKASKKSNPAPRQPSATYSFTTGDDSTVISDQSSRGERRSHHARPSSHRPQRPRRSSRHSSPVRQSGPQYTYRDRESAYQPSEANSYMYNDSQSEATGDYGTKSYRHVIPGLSTGTRSEAPNNDRRVERGFRRGGGGRRDSLSDSDGETNR